MSETPSLQIRIDVLKEKAVNQSNITNMFKNVGLLDTNLHHHRGDLKGTEVLVSIGGCGFLWRAAPVLYCTTDPSEL